LKTPPKPVLLESTRSTGFHSIGCYIRLVPNVRLGVADRTAVAARESMEIRTFWFHTIGISVVLAVLLAVALALVTATGALAFGQKNADPPESGKAQIFFGVLTDAHCGARHPSKSHLSAGDCTKMCLKQGSAWALVDGEKFYTLKGDSPVLDQRAGERVTVSGTLDGNTIQVQSVESQNR